LGGGLVEAEMQYALLLRTCTVGTGKQRFFHRKGRRRG
jgi:hypothetical protein